MKKSVGEGERERERSYGCTMNMVFEFLEFL